MNSIHLRSSRAKATSGLVEGESPTINLAYLSKTTKMWNQISIELWVAAPMVKVILLEFYWENTSGEGYSLVCDRRLTTSNPLLIRGIEGSVVVQTVGNSQTKKGTPKGTTSINCKLRDCLKAPTGGTHGNRGSIVVKSKWARMYSCESDGKKSGIRLKESWVGAPDSHLPKKFTKLVNICTFRRENFKASDIYDLMFNEKLYEAAYKKIKSKPGNMTPGADQTTLDGTSQSTFRDIIKSLKDESFQFSPGRRVNIPKPNGGTRSLTVASPRDKIVQEVMRMILEVIFEPTFSDNSHGFRINRSCHTALKQIKGEFVGASHFIEGDITKCFDSVDHHLLIELLEERINDPRFIRLIWKSLRAGYYEFEVRQRNIIGTPQGSIISPILANIYLHKLDIFMESMKARFDKGKIVARNPIYRKHEALRYKALKMGNRLEARLQLKNMQKHKARLHNDPNFRRLYYVRYADDWIVSIRGSFTETKLILLQIKHFLREELRLDLSEAKTKITTPRHRPALFLGTLIKISDHVNFTRGKHGQKLKAVSQIVMVAPLDRIYKKLAGAKLMNLNTKKGTPRFLWYPQRKDTIVTLYNSILRGYLNYYSFANNYPRVAASLEWILKGSCSRLLAAKFKLRTIGQVIKKYGKDLKGRDKIAFYKPSYKTNVWDFKINVPTDLNTLYATRISAASLDNLACSKCGSELKVEMHHVRKLKDLNPKLSEIDRLMASKKRKQIPLCRKCHIEHHVKHSPWGNNKKRKASKMRS
jgi:group II intron reverse transcriptase/maturase